MKYVLDASVAVKWVLPEPDTVNALRDAYRNGIHELIAPDIFPVEVAHALTFLTDDSVKWRKDHGCATCHHGTMTVWALSEAMKQGFPVGAEALAETVQWTKNQFVPRFSKPRDPRPGWELVNTNAIYLGIMSQDLPVLSRDEVNTIAVHLARHQVEDGGWKLPPPKNGAPPIWESRESLALLALLAWEPHIPADPQEAAAASASREKAGARRPSFPAMLLPPDRRSTHSVSPA